MVDMWLATIYNSKVHFALVFQLDSFNFMDFRYRLYGTLMGPISNTYYNLLIRFDKLFVKATS